LVVHQFQVHRIGAQPVMRTRRHPVRLQRDRRNRLPGHAEGLA
jgi:hypothetical protein